jgi:hypothetical protein
MRARTNDFPADLGNLAKERHREAIKAYPSLVDDPMVISYVFDKQRRKNLTYLPAQLHVPVGQPTKVNWISWDGDITLEFYPILPQTDAHNPLEGKPKTFSSNLFGSVRVAEATVNTTTKGYYHFKVTLTVGNEKLYDPSCPPIIVE